MTRTGIEPAISASLGWWWACTACSSGLTSWEQAQAPRITVGGGEERICQECERERFEVLR